MVTILKILRDSRVWEWAVGGGQWEVGSGKWEADGVVRELSCVYGL
jgi:hypothetical protein